VRIYDPDVDPSKMVGANLAYINVHLPHLARWLVATPEQALLGADAVLLCKKLLSKAQLASLIQSGMAVHDIELHWAALQR
jgi:GDP-mannose 6-dehydrogenase